MLKQTVTYHDFDGNEVVEDFYFNLNQTEIAELGLGANGMAEKVRVLQVSEDQSEVLTILRDILAKAVGKRSADGKQFVKDEKTRGDFIYTNAYDALCMRLLRSPVEMVNFFVSVVPHEAGKMVAARMIQDIPGIDEFDIPILKENPVKAIHQSPETLTVQATRELKNLDEYTDEELRHMDESDLKQLINGIKGNNIPKRLMIIAMQRGVRL